MKNFILIIFAVFFTVFYANRLIADTNNKLKCDYYTDNISKLLRGEILENITTTGIICDAENNKIYVPIKNGKVEGIVKEYYESGALKLEVPFKNGKKEGILKDYDENGVLQNEIPFKKDVIEGIVKIYYENGNIHQEIPFKNGVEEGISKKNNENGSHWGTVTYQNGKAVSGKCANGRKLNKAELSNWDNGLSVSCGN